MASRKPKKPNPAGPKAADSGVEEILASIRRQIHAGGAEGDDVLVLTKLAPLSGEEPEPAAPGLDTDAALERLVRDTLSALVRDYLDRTLPGLVEKITREQLAETKKRG